MKIALRATVLACTIAGATNVLQAQIPCYDSNLGVDLGLLDDNFSPVLPLGFTFTYGGVAYTDIQVCSNGFLVFGNGAPGAADYTPTVAELLTNPQARLCPVWMDLNPSIAGSGHVWSNAVPATPTTPGYVTVTWDGVFNFGGTTPHSVQVTLVDDNRILINSGANLATNANTWVIGASPGNGAAANAVNFAVRPLINAGNPTLHQNGTGAMPVASSNLEWLPDGIGGYIVVDRQCGHSSYGNGCYNTFRSLYEEFGASGTFDLSGTTITMIPAGNAYLVLTAPLTNFFTPAAGALALGDDTISTGNTLPSAFPYPGGSTTALDVHSNGQVFLNGGGLADYTASVAELLARGASISAWMDFNPAAAGSGGVHVDVDLTTNIAYVTWNGVFAYGTSSANTFQFAFFLTGSSAPGQIELRFQTLTNNATLAAQCITGYTPGNGALDPGSRDLSAITAFVTGDADLAALALSASPAPSLGATITFTVSNIPAAAILSAHLWSFGQIAAPGLDLGFLGAPGCNQLITLPATTILLFGTPTATNQFTVPNNPAYSGLVFFTQAASLNTASNALGVITSNGLRTQL